MGIQIASRRSLLAAQQYTLGHDDPPTQHIRNKGELPWPQLWINELLIGKDNRWIISGRGEFENDATSASLRNRLPALAYLAGDKAATLARIVDNPVWGHDRRKPACG